MALHKRNGIYHCWAIKEEDIDPFALVLYRAIHIVERMRYCANPECPAPYFLTTRRNQVCCSDACAPPAQRDLKRRW